MVAPPDTVFLDGLDFFTAAVRRLDRTDWPRPSPCADWRAVDVLGHVGAGVRFGTELLGDAHPKWEPVEPPGAVVAGDPGAWWAGLVRPAAERVRGADLSRVVESPMGRRTVAEGLRFPALDLFVHGWDLTRVVGADVEIPAEVIEFARAVIDRVPTEQLRSPKVFAAAVPVPSDATPTESFIAWTGRDPRWQPPADRPG